MLLAAAVCWGLINLRALTLPVTYPNDSAMHEQMVRFATAQWKAGVLPLTSWYPYLGEGSPQFLHYQSLPAMIAGAAGLIVGPDVAFRWSLYLLLALWPVAVFCSARLFGATRGAAGASAVMAPFLVSPPGVGYEQGAYVLIGYGVWTQLWAMWTLPVAWGLSWRAIRNGRGYLAAAACIALTVAMHFETGYLALAVLLVWPAVAGRPFITSVRRVTLLLVGALLASAWVIVPVLAQSRWASVNEPLQGTSLVDGYGAHKVLVWLFSGQLLDSGRLPVLSIFAAIGFGVAWMGWSANRDGRALIAALAISLLLSFGPATWGALTDVVPGHSDLFFRRFMMGGQLAALLLAGRGAAWSLASALRWLERHWWRWYRIRGWLSPTLVAILTVVILAPAWVQLDRYDRRDSAAIGAQRRADAGQGAALNRLVGVIRREGGGRTYAGMPSNWGQTFTVGQVAVFKYLASEDVDEVGFTLRTASLMTDPEFNFNERDPSDYRLFAVRYLLLPAGRNPPVPARLLLRSGPYALWTIGADGYIQAGRIVGHMAANRSNVGRRSVPLLDAGLAAEGAYLSVDWGSATEPSRLPAARGSKSSAKVVSQSSNLTRGRASAIVRMRRPGVAVLSASYDPGWTATVNGQPQPTRMVAPALVGVKVPAGTDRVVFLYRGYSGYPLLFSLAGLTLVGLGVGPMYLARRRGRRRTWRTLKRSQWSS